MSDEKEILSFTLQDISSTPQWEGQILYLLAHEEMDLSKPFTPAITISKNATVYPPSDIPQIFSEAGVKYVVTAQSGNTKEFIVKLRVLKSENQILDFQFQGINSHVKITDSTIHIIVYDDVNLSSLYPAIIYSEGAHISPSTNAPQDFTSDVMYEVVAQNGEKQKYTVVVEKYLKTDHDILSFDFSHVKCKSIIADSTIWVELYEKVDLTKLAPTIEISDLAILSPRSGMAQDFTDTVFYEVTAQSGKKKKYQVLVTEVLNDPNNIISFSFPNLEYKTVILNDTVYVELYDNITLNNLAPIVEISDKAIILPNAGEPQNFENDVTYVVTSESGKAHTYIVRVSKVLNDDKEILSFAIPNKVANVAFKDNVINVEAYTYVDVSSLTPIITCSPKAAVSPQSGQAVDFSNPVTYTVTAQDGSTAEYTVAVNKSLSRQNDIESIQLAGTEQIFEREGDNLFVYVPYETDITSIATEITVSEGATISPASGTFMNFTTPQIYTVTASDGTSKNYLVTVKKSPWRKVGNGPFSIRDDIVLIELNGKLFMFRGWINSNPFPLYSREVWTTEDGLTWTKALAEVPWNESTEFKNYLSFVKFNDKIWVFGAGTDGDETWNTSDGVNWIFVNNSSITSTWGRRYWPYIGVFKNELYVIGGLNWWDEVGNYIRNGVGSGVYNDIWTSDDGVNWIQEKSFSQLPPRGMVSGFAVLNDILYIVGGGINIGAVSLEYNDVWASSNGKDWYCYNANTPWGKTAYNSVTVYNNKIFVAAGTLNGEGTSNQIWCSSDGVTWSQVKHSFFPKRHAAGLVSFKGKLWLVAGYGLNDIWCYDPAL